MKLIGSLLFILSTIALFIAAAYGWVMHVVAISHAWGGAVTAELVIRLVGIPVIPLGAILGYL